MSTEQGSDARIRLWDMTSRHSEDWQSFRQVAKLSDGTPSLQCLRCNMAIRHPAASQATAGNLGKHLATVKCMEAGADIAVSTDYQASPLVL